MDAAPIRLIAEFAVRIVLIRDDAVIRYGFDLLEQFGRLERVFRSGFLCGEIELCGSGLRLAELLALLAEDLCELGWRPRALLGGSCKIEAFHMWRVCE